MAAFWGDVSCEREGREGREIRKTRPSALFRRSTSDQRSGLEDENALMIELRAKVDELTARNEYQLRLHDRNHSEKLKEVAEK